MENTSIADESGIPDPQEQLALLNSERRTTVATGSLLLETPMWQAPALAAVMGATAAWLLQPMLWTGLGMIGALVITGLCIRDNFRRRTVKVDPAEMKVTAVGAGIGLLIVVVALGVMLGWFLALNGGGSIRLWAVLPAWIGSTAVNMAELSFLNGWRENVIERSS